MSQPDSSQLLKQLAPTFVILGLSKVDIVELGLLDVVRVLYFVVHAVAFVGMFKIYQKIQANPPEGTIKVPAVKQFGTEVKPAEEQSAEEYDMSKFKEQCNQLGIGFIMICLMHFKWEYVLPLPIQCIMVPMNYFDAPLVKIYLRGQAAEGKLKRPFPTPNPFGMPSSDDGAEKTRKEERAEKRAAKKAD